MGRDHHLPCSAWACGAAATRGAGGPEQLPVPLRQRATHAGTPWCRPALIDDDPRESRHHRAPTWGRCEGSGLPNSNGGRGPGGFGSAHAARQGRGAARQANGMCSREREPCASQRVGVDGTAGDAAQRRCSPRVAAGWALWGLAVSSVLGRGSAMQAYNGGAMVLADSGPGGPMSSPAYANTFETWNTFSKRTSTSPVTFRLQAETKFGWEVCVTGGCEALGYWDPDKALLLRTDPSRYPIWEGVGQLPGGCDIEYKYLMRPRGRSLADTPCRPELACAIAVIRRTAAGSPLPECRWCGVHSRWTGVTRRRCACAGPRGPCGRTAPTASFAPAPSKRPSSSSRIPIR